MPHKRAKRSVRQAESAKKGFNLAPSSSSSSQKFSKDDTPRSASRIFNSFAIRQKFKESGRVTSEDTGERERDRDRDSSKSGSKGNVRIEKGKGKERQGESVNTTDVGTNAIGKRKRDDKDKEKEKGKGKEKEKGKNTIAPPPIKHHESLADYNRRIENLFRPGLAKAMKTASTSTSTSTSASASAGAGASNSKGKQLDLMQVEDELPATSKGSTHAPLEFKKADQRKRVNDIAQAPPELRTLKKAKVHEAQAGGGGGGGGVWAARGKGRDGLSIGQRRVMEEERKRVVDLYREMKAKREAERSKDGR